MPIDNNFSSNIIDHLYYFNNVTAEISKEFYINLNCNIIQYKRFREVLQNILKNKKIKGIIFNPNFFDDHEIKYITNANLSERNLDIICNSDEFYLEALKNNNSIISKYINVFSEYFLDIHDHYYNKQLTEAINLQENLNNKILKLSRYGDLQSIKYLFKLGKFDLGGVRNIYYQLNEEEKSKLKNNYFQS